MATDKKQKAGNKDKREKRGSSVPAESNSSSSSKWRGPLLMAVAALCLNRGLQYHRYWNSLSPVVEVQQGQLQGRSDRTDSGREYFAFQGVPYAKPPLGALRFRDPEAPESWAPQVRDARADGPICMQPAMKFPAEMPRNLSAMDVVRILGAVPNFIHRAVKRMRMSEDCLHLNVYTPKVGRDGEGLPVIVYIHGGAFVYGDNGVDLLGPKYFMEHDVVLVTIQYRLGPLGFLKLGTQANAGLKDAAAALRWVHENVASFGGDPGKVTVAGQSAGGAITHYLTLTPSTKGLFRSAICMSGSALHHWAFSAPEMADKRTDLLLRHLVGADVDAKSPEDLLRHLQGLDAALFADENSYLDKETDLKWLMDEFPYQPSVDGSFLPAPPLDLIRGGRAHQVPVMLGVTAREGLFFYPSAATKNRTMQEQTATVDTDFYYALPEYMRAAFPRGSAALKRVEQAVRDFYFNKGAISADSVNQFIDFYGVLMFDYDTHRLSKELAAISSAPIYAYNFTFEGRLNLFRRVMLYTVPELTGATHCDELNYLFDVSILPHIPLNENDPEIILRKTLFGHLLNFVKFGNPTPAVTSETPFKWQPVTRNAFPVLNFDVPIALQQGFRPADTSFWDKLYQNNLKHK